MLISAGKKQCEICQGDALWCPSSFASAAQNDLPFVEGEVKGRLKLRLQFVALVDEDDRSRCGGEQDAIQIRSMFDGLSQYLEVISSEFSTDRLTDG